MYSSHLLLDDIVVHGELGQVGDEPGHVAHEEHHDDADQHHREVHLVVVTRVVAVGPPVGEPKQESQTSFMNDPSIHYLIFL